MQKECASAMRAASTFQPTISSLAYATPIEEQALPSIFRKTSIVQHVAPSFEPSVHGKQEAARTKQDAVGGEEPSETSTSAQRAASDRERPARGRPQAPLRR
jgi:hypothetical protein